MKNSKDSVSHLVLILLVVITVLTVYIFTKSQSTKTMPQKIIEKLSTENTAATPTQETPKSTEKSPTDSAFPTQDLEALFNNLNSTIEWKIYKNDNCGISIKYPIFLKVKENGCEIAFYFGNGETAYSYCPLAHLSINNNSCGSLAYKGTATLLSTKEVLIDGIAVKRSDYGINGLILESTFADIQTKSNIYALSFYNGGDNLEQVNKIRDMFNIMVESIAFTK